MLIEELDGFLAGILVCPDMIPPSAWLPLVWNSEGDEESAFADLQHLNRVMGLVMDHYNRIAGTLFDKPDGYAPLFAVDKRNGDVLWRLTNDTATPAFRADAGPTTAASSSIGRNEPCPCGSSKKYKKCCGLN